VVFAVAAALATPAAGHADDPPDTPEDPKVLARQQYHEAEKQYRIGQFQLALKHYMAALKLSPRPSLMYNLAQCYRVSKQPDKALFYYKLYLSEWKRRKSDAPEPFVFREARRHIVQLTARIKAREAELRAKEAEQQLQERLRQEAKWRTEQMNLLKELFKWKQQAHERHLADIREMLRRMEEQNRRRPGLINLTGLHVKGAKVELDGTAVARAPLHQPLRASTGEHRIRVTAGGYRPWTARVTVEPGQTSTVLVQLSRVPTRKKFLLVLSLTSLALAAGAEATAVVFANSANEHFQGTDAFARDQLISNTGHISAGVLGAVAVTTFVLYMVSHRWGGDSPFASALAPGAGGTAATGVFRF